MKTLHHISICDLLINFIMNDNKLKYYYINKFPHSKYKLTDIINDILYILKTGISWRSLKINYKIYFSIYTF